MKPLTVIVKFCNDFGHLLLKTLIKVLKINKKKFREVSKKSYRYKKSTNTKKVLHIFKKVLLMSVKTHRCH